MGPWVQVVSMDPHGPMEPNNGAAAPNARGPSPNPAAAIAEHAPAYAPYSGNSPRMNTRVGNPVTT